MAAAGPAAMGQQSLGLAVLVALSALCVLLAKLAVLACTWARRPHHRLAALLQIKQLHGLTAPAPADTTDRYYSDHLPPKELPDTRWKHLIKEKVPYDLGVLCSKPLTGPGSHVNSAAAATASFQLLTQLLISARKAGLFGADKQQQQQQTGRRATAKQNLGQSLLQQLQQSGLPQQLPVLLAALTTQLQQISAAAQSSSSSSLGVDNIPGVTANLSCTTLLAMHVLGSCDELAHNQEQGQHVVFAPAAAGPAAQLALATLQYVALALQQQQQMEAGGVMSVLVVMAETAYHVAKWVIVDTHRKFTSEASSSSRSRRRDAPQSQLSQQQLHTYTVVLSLYAVQTLYHDSLDTVASATSGGGSSSSGRAPAAAASSNDTRHVRGHQAWQLASQHQQQLPFVPAYLFEVLGLSRQLLAWLAALSLDDSNYIMPMHHLLFTWCGLAQEQEHNLQRQQQQRQLPLLLEQEQHVAQVMLSTVVLKNLSTLVSSSGGGGGVASGGSSNRPKADFLLSACEAQHAIGSSFQCAQECLNAYREHPQQQQQQQQQQQGQTGREAGSSLCRQAMTTVEGYTEMYGVWLDGALPVLLDTMSSLLQVAKANPSSSSGSSSSSSANEQGFALDLLRAFVMTLGMAASVTVKGEKLSSGDMRISACPAWSVDGAPGQLMAVLEGYTRLTAAAAGGRVRGLPDGYLAQQHWSGRLAAGPWGILQALQDEGAAAAAAGPATTAAAAGLATAAAAAAAQTAAAARGVVREKNFVSLLCSLLRLAGSGMKLQDPFGMQHVCCNVLFTAGRVLAKDTAAAAAAAAAAGAAGVAVSLGGGSGAASGPGVVAGESEAVLAKLPFVVLFGRCCALLAYSFDTLDIVVSNRVDNMKFVRYYAQQGFEERCHIVAEWLEGFEPQLTAAGYSLEPMHEQLGDLGAASATACAFIREYAIAAAPTAPVLESAQAAVGRLVQQLQCFAEAAAAIAVPNFCNNPGCGNISGVSESALVSGRTCICSACHTARYCSKACQKKHWKQHKPVCKALAAAAAAAAGGGAAGTS